MNTPQFSRFQYEILIGRPGPNNAGVIYQLGSSGQVLGPNLIQILNNFGQQGWEVVSVADLGFGAQNDILLKR